MAVRNERRKKDRGDRAPVSPEFVLAHISDLHFCVAAEAGSPHRHSDKHLLELEKQLRTLDYDRLVITGDISNHGDSDSLSLARDWLISRVTRPGGMSTGLDLGNLKRVILIPGNHDAFNAKRSRKLLQSWQSSTANFRDTFPEVNLPSPYGVGYDWLQKGDFGLFIALADSCYLGDPDLAGDPFGKFKGIAKGKISLDQSNELLLKSRQGLKGLLPDPNEPGKSVDRARFATSLKILLMHHYLFSPAGGSDSYFMSVDHRDDVFRNIAMADFDAMLCGHSHVATWQSMRYGERFDLRARRRYLFNYLRQAIGLGPLPLQLRDSSGRWMSKTATMAINVLVKMRFLERRQHSTIPELVEELAEALRNPSQFQERMRSFFKFHAEDGEAAVRPEEIQEIYAHISSELDDSGRKALKDVATGIRRAVRLLEQRPFVQAMSGSSAKKRGPKSGGRSYCVHRIRRTEAGWSLRSERFDWDDTSMTFASPTHPSETFEMQYEDKRRPSYA
ncbi:MAG: metallophosphoesterase [Thermoanaerobaculia bacterium]